MTFRVEFYPFFNSCLSKFWGKDPTSWNVAGTQSVQLHINTCKLMPGLPKISRPFLTAVSRVHCAKNTKQRKGPGKSRLFFTLKKKAKSWKNSRNVSFQLFRDSWDINITEESWFTLCRRQILKTSGFSWGKGALFLGFRNGEWKLKKGYPFFSFECEIQINTLIFRHFSFSLSAFFAKSRIAGTDHWLLIFASRC